VMFFKEHFYDLYEMIPGFAAGFICCIGVSLLGSPDEDSVRELEDVRRVVGPMF
jgi:Na+/proline symporter